MRGEKVNISNIEKSIKEELNELKDNIKEFSEETKQHFKKKEKSKVARERSAQAAAGLIQVLAKAAGIILIFFAFSFIVALISAIYMLPLGFHMTPGVLHASLPEMLSAVLTSAQWVSITLLSIVLIVGIPVFWMLMAGIQLLFDIKTSSRYLGLITFIIWLAAVATLSLAFVSGARNFTSHHESSTEYVLERSQWPNLYIHLNEPKFPEDAIRRNRLKVAKWNYLWQETTEDAMGIPELRLKASQSDEILLEVIKESRGPSLRHASQNVESIEYSFLQKDSLLILDPVFYFDKADGWRNQQVKLQLSIPEDKVAMLQKNLRKNMWVQWPRSVSVVEQ
jgi:hypothetical protein